MTAKRGAIGSGPRPSDTDGTASGMSSEDIAYYALGYTGDPQPHELFRYWLACLHDARALEAESDGVDKATGLSFADLGEGARVRSRHYAMLAALRKARTVEDIGWKILMRTIIENDAQELNMSHVALLLRVSAAADADEMGLGLAPFSHILQ